MYLRTQTEEAIIDIEKCTSVVIEENNVYVNLAYGGSFLCGTYKTKERAKEIVGEIFALLDVQTRYDMPIV